MNSEEKPTGQLIELFRRQLILEDWGLGAQEKLRAAKVLVVGCGGLGAPVIQYLAAAGVGTLTLMDDDRVQRSNLNRQVLFGDADIGRLKTDIATQWIKTRYPQINVEGSRNV